MIPDPVPTPATFVAPPGGLPPFEVYDAIVQAWKTSLYLSEHYRELAGSYVAWAFDGSFVYAAATPEELHATLAPLGRENYISDYVDPLPVVIVPAATERRAS